MDDEGVVLSLIPSTPMKFFLFSLASDLFILSTSHKNILPYKAFANAFLELLAFSGVRFVAIVSFPALILGRQSPFSSVVASLPSKIAAFSRPESSPDECMRIEIVTGV